MIDQADCQVAAARRRPIEWYFAEWEPYVHVSAMFAAAEIPIVVKYAPMPR